MLAGGIIALNDLAGAKAGTEYDVHTYQANEVRDVRFSATPEGRVRIYTHISVSVSVAQLAALYICIEDANNTELISVYRGADINAQSSVYIPTMLVVPAGQHLKVYAQAGTQAGSNVHICLSYIELNVEET